MSTDFVTTMSKEERSFAPLRFMAADHFTPYWRCFLPAPLAPDEVRVVQEAARAAVDRFMEGEESFWLIDFSHQNTLATWRLFADRTSSLRPEAKEAVEALSQNLAVSAEETRCCDYFLSVVTRLRYRAEVREELGYSKQDAHVLDAAYERAGDAVVDMGRIQKEWLASTSPWDVRLKAQTSDLPESVHVIFTMAYRPRTELPLLLANLRTLLDEPERRAFLARLTEAWKRSLSPDMMMELPPTLQS